MEDFSSVSQLSNTNYCPLTFQVTIMLQLHVHIFIQYFLYCNVFFLNLHKWNPQKVYIYCC